MASHFDLAGHRLEDHAGGMIDLDEEDGDLLPQGGHGYHVSPLAAGEARGGAGPSSGGANGDPPKIKVVVRKRPISMKERERGEEDIVEVIRERNCVTVNETKFKVDLTKYVERHQFVFDESLDEYIANDDVYTKTVQPLVGTLFRNGRATCFAYGQTGSGKTYTMSPLPIRAAADILAALARPANEAISLYLSCFEIYGNKVFDLLNSRKKLNILEDGKRKVVVVGLREYCVDSVELVKTLIAESTQRRSTGSTAANADSSRSHSIMQFALKKGEGGALVGKISFIDLAGSERGADTFDNNRQTRMEGAEINKSLLALKECIRALDSEARHVPFRGSKLTAVLRDSFVGAEARTVMIANISPNGSSVEHTLNTLRYADRVKELRKDKADRSAGGVTPGDADNYYAAAQRGAHQQAHPELEPISEGPPGNAARRGALAPPPAAALREKLVAERRPAYRARDDTSATDNEDESLLSARDELMNSILEEEEELINAHRFSIEEAMEIVRREMNLLTEVDQPGSAIDQYVDALQDILAAKAAAIMQLQRKVEAFKGKLQEEERMSRTVRAPKSRFGY